MGIEEIISKDLNIPEEMILGAISTARKHVKIFSQKKRNGGVRKIAHPSKNTKVIQYWLMGRIFEKIFRSHT